MINPTTPDSPRKRERSRMVQCSILRSHIETFEASLVRVKTLLAGADSETANRQPQPGAWSALQAIEHLNTTAQVYFPRIEQALAAAEKGSPPYEKGTLTGRLMLKQMAPSAGKRMKSPKVFRPPTTALTVVRVLDDFERDHARWIDLIERSDGLDLGSARVRLPLPIPIHETEPTVDITIEVVDPFNALDDSIFLATLTIDDVDDAPTDITPLAILADENVPGAELEVITIVDADSTDGYILEVADERFEIVDGVLRLREGVSLDYESGGTITVPVSVRDGSGELLLTRDVQIYVQDQNDAPTDIYLSGNQIPEMVSGHTVGAITVIDPDAVDQHSLSVDDSRFEIVGTTLKLRDGVHVRRSEQAEIVVNITATDLALASFSRQFTLTVLENDSPWTNPDSPTDVDGSGETTPLDALIIINTLNNDGPRDLIDPFPVTSEAVRYYDVNGDGRITPIDALIIINILNRGGSSAEPEAPGDGSGDDSPSSNPESDSFPTPGPMPHSPSDDDDEEKGSGTNSAKHPKGRSGYWFLTPFPWIGL